eukprot:Seg451.5 transcript_id=Seg451.5/GoldUCD/mRNA.D3Y31 product=Ryncolin-3 protein_id=Seg451.5/GoldUCD/D3Y31
MCTNEEKNKTCQLNGNSIADPRDLDRLIPAPGWKFWSTNYTETLVGHGCKRRKPCPKGFRCEDTCECPGYRCIPLYDETSSCAAGLNRDRKISNLYRITNKTVNPFLAHCFLHPYNGRGFLLIQRRIDGSTDFYRGWEDYKHGFGNLEGNFWIGLEKLHQLAGPGKGALLRIDMKHASSDKKFRASYEVFEVANEADNYRLRTGKYHGNSENRLAQNNGRQFSTFDRDNDATSRYNCAKMKKGAWWYASCEPTNLNGLYPSKGEVGGKYMTWFDIGGTGQKDKYGGITYSQMSIEWK